jgi:hypothetical protein
MNMNRAFRLALSCAAAFATSAAAQSAATPPIPRFDPGAFRSASVTNPFFPLEPGTTYIYAVRDGTRTSVDSLTVTREQKTIGGVAVVVVHDRVRRDGKLVEDTRDWYAQDTTGTVWYLGEATTSYEGRRPSTSGSWQHGVDGARAGIIMHARPVVGAAYRQEYRKGVAEDMGRVVSVDDTVSVPAGRYSACVTTEDWSPLEPETLERKTYCRGVGVVREMTVKGGREIAELVAIRQAQPPY